MDPQLYEAGLYMMTSLSGNQGEISTPTSHMKEEDYTYMDESLQKAADEGNFESFKGIEKELSLIITPDKNTILHVHIRSQSSKRPEAETSTRFMKQVLDKCPSLLLQKNDLGDTPLHVAAKYGDTTAADFLIDGAKVENQSGLDDVKVKEMLGKTNNEGNTALHEAVRHSSTDVVGILTKAVPGFSYSINNLGETPLYIAADRGPFDGIGIKILHNCRKLAYEGPHGRTALHAAVKNRKDELVETLLTKEKSLAKKVDEYGWTPLHYAVYNDLYNDHGDMVGLLFQFDVSAAYTGDRDRKMTPLHLAASQGLISTMNYIIDKCPTCYELVDIKGRNFFHYAILALKKNEYQEIKRVPLEKLMNQKDVEGNTPLHLFISLYPTKSPTLISMFHFVGINNIFVTNKQGLSVLEIEAHGGYRQLQQELLELSKTVAEPYRHGIITIPHKFNENDEEVSQVTDIEKARESHLVVAALIATVTFAAAFTLPGGYIQDGPGQGTAILKRKYAFQAFFISNAVAMVLSVSAVFFHFIMSILKTFRNQIFLFRYAFYFTLLAMGAMLFAFITGAYAMLAFSWLAIFIIFIGLSFFFIVFYQLIKIVIDVHKKSVSEVVKGLEIKSNIDK